MLTLRWPAAATRVKPMVIGCARGFPYTPRWTHGTPVTPPLERDPPGWSAEAAAVRPKLSLVTKG